MTTVIALLALSPGRIGAAAITMVRQR